MYGMGDWKSIAQHVGTRSNLQVFGVPGYVVLLVNRAVYVSLGEEPRTTVNGKAGATV